MDLYNNQYCMNFSNQEIIEYLVKPVQSVGVEVRLVTESDKDPLLNTEQPITAVFFGDNRNEFNVAFYENE